MFFFTDTQVLNILVQGLKPAFMPKNIHNMSLKYFFYWNLIQKIFLAQISSQKIFQAQIWTQKIFLVQIWTKKTFWVQIKAQKIIESNLK